MSRYRHVLVLLLGVLLFWSLRIYYWSLTEEQPFSDMGDFLEVGRAILHNWHFANNPFWLTYKPPTLPLMVAAVFGLFGDMNLVAWRYCLALFVFGGLLCASFVLARTTRRPWLGYVMFLVVSLSKPSIFWSYKVASEATAEGFNYYCIAALLLVLRKPTILKLFLLGALFTAAALNRPQFVIVLPVFGILFLIKRIGGGPFWGRTVPLAVAFAVGSLLLWSPWLIRSYRLYGHVVPLTTQGPYSFLWELGPVTIQTEDGSRITRDWQQLQAEAPTQFDNDYLAQAYGNKFVRAWIADHLWEYPGIIHERFWRTLHGRSIYLTKVSRQDLFSGSLNWFLLDKHTVLMLTGLVGLICLAFLCPGTYGVGVLAVAPWFFGLCFLGYPRILEPSIPLLLFGNAPFLWAAARVASRSRSLPQRLLIKLYALANKAGLLEKPWFRRLVLRGYFAYKKYYEDPFYRLTKRRPDLFANGHILDIGANVGYTATTFARVLDSKHKVFAFEPEPRNFERLQETLSISAHKDRVVPVQAAVGDHAGTTQLWLNEAHHGDHRVLTDRWKERVDAKDAVASVPLITIDDYASSNVDGPISFIKIDVQGYEPQVLQGMVETLKANPGASIAFEYSPGDTTELGSDPSEVLAFFESRGYGLQVISGGGQLSPVDHQRLQASLAKRGYIDLLASKSA